MTVKITVSVNGNHKIPVTQGETTTWVSGRDHDGPVLVDFTPHDYGRGMIVTIGPEENDNGEAAPATA